MIGGGCLATETMTLTSEGGGHLQRSKLQHLLTIFPMDPQMALLL